ncbi:type 1 fimbrial protein [Enterobacter sp. 9-2]|nr:type 1 fimbrial protein [Enterobacter sp. 9-2]
MKKGLGGCVWLAVLSVVSTFTGAAEHQGQDIGGTVGQLHVSGTLQEIACRLDMPSRRQAVTLPTASAFELLRVGERGEATPFTLRLTGCLRAAGVVLNERNNTLAWSSQQPLVMLTFSAPADASSPGLFQVTGAGGIGLRLTDAKGNTLRPGERSAPQFLSPGDNALLFSVAPERTLAPLSPGGYRATLDFQLHYH